MKSRKRLLSIFLSLAVMVTMCITTAAAIDADNGSAATITVETVKQTVMVDDEVTLNVSIANNPGFVAFDFTIRYDQEKLELLSIEDGSFKGYLTGNPDTGKVNFTAADVQRECTEDGTLFTLKFRVKADCSDGTQVKIETTTFKNAKNQPILPTIVPGGTTGDSTTGGSTTGGSTTGGSTTGGSTTGGSTTGGSTTGGSTTGGSTTGGSTTGGSTTGGSTTGGSTTGGSTTGGSTTGGSTTGGSTTGGSTTGGSTTGGSTTGGSTTGGSMTGGSTTGGSTTGGSTTGGSTTGGSTTGGSTTGGSTTGGSTTGGSTTGGSTTGGSTTGGSTTGGSTTGGSTTGGSTTGGSTTGGSTTGGSTTGGSTTGGSTTGGSTTGGSTTGGSTTGGSTTGGSTTGSERKVELIGTGNGATYTITGNTLSAKNDTACVVLWTADNGKTYTKLTATANEQGGYDFDLKDVPANAVIQIAVKGDANGDGVLGFADATMVMNAYGNDAPLSAIAELIADVDGISGIQFSDATRIMNAWGNDQYLNW